MKQELGPNQLEWIEALESGKFEQGYDGYLCIDNKYCCLGVACEVLLDEDAKDGTNVISWFGEFVIAPKQLTEKLKLHTFNGATPTCTKSHDATVHDSLVFMNDREKRSFKEIAQILREYPEEYFRCPA